MGVYYGLCLAFPRQVHPTGTAGDLKMSFEELAGNEGYLSGEQVIEFQLRTLEGMAENRSSSSGIESINEAPKHDV